MINGKKVGLFLPTLNAGNAFKDTLQRIEKNKDIVDRFLIIDSGSNDNTVQLAMDHGFTVENINKSEFTHGLVRKRASRRLQDCDFIIYMTQDALLQEDAFNCLLSFIESHDDMLVAYGKQEVQMEKSNIFEYEARKFNYPSESQIRSLADKEKFGIKTVFNSDAFAVYNRRLLEQVGNFPEKVNFEEDMFMAARGILNGLTVGYCADAKIYHSHHYTLKQEYRRYRSIGHFHKENPWIQKEFGSNEHEGVKSVITEWKFLIKHGKPHLILYSGLRVVAKYLGYRLG